MYLNLEDIRTIQLDHTSRCNLACPQCARYHGSTTSLNPHMNITDLTLEDYEIILEDIDVKNVGLFHCGNFGDSIVSPTFESTLEYSMTSGIKYVKISTNGSMRSPDWWRSLAKNYGDRIIINFSIDGLKDTNHIYRINSVWEKIVENASAFISAGGNASWYFIEFEHNYHQIEEAKALASKMGFAKFNVKYTSRFADQNQTAISTKVGTVVKDIPLNKNQIDMNRIKMKYISFEDYVNTTPISCKYKKDKSVFIDLNMKLWPCTWLGAPPYFNLNNAQRKSFQSIYDKYGMAFNDMRINGWRSLEHDFFKTYLERSWDSPDEEYKRIFTCGRTCGEEFEFSSGYGKNTSKSNLK